LQSTARVFLLLAAALFPLTGCLLRTHKVERRAVSAAPLRDATLPELVERLNADAEKVRTMNATVDIAASSGGEKKGKVTEFQEIRGYVLLRKPDMLRMIGLFPVVRNRAFDMVSDGEQFRLSLPTRGKFIVGTKEVTRPSKQPLENLRPQHIQDALLVHQLDPKHEIPFLENGVELVRDPKSKKDVEQPNYVIGVLRRGDDGGWYLHRKIHISRVDLAPRRQVIFDKNGSVATIATYDNFEYRQGVNFPNIIQIDRPQEEYSIQLGMVKLMLNAQLKDEQFVLTQPPGSQLVNIDQQSATVSGGNGPPGPKNATAH
jgi:outer membrane lipoprotein-sorting protein